MNLKIFSILAVATALAGCVSREHSQANATQANATSDTKVVKSIDGSYEGVISGTINPDSRFSKLKIGMKKSDVQALIGIPDDMYSYESGKRWIPFYFGNDAKRINAYYQGDGCLVYTGGGGFGIPGGQLIGIFVDKTKACFK